MTDLVSFSDAMNSPPAGKDPAYPIVPPDIQAARDSTRLAMLQDEDKNDPGLPARQREIARETGKGTVPAGPVEAKPTLVSFKDALGVPPEAPAPVAAPSSGATSGALAGLKKASDLAEPLISKVMGPLQEVGEAFKRASDHLVLTLEDLRNSQNAPEQIAASAAQRTSPKNIGH